MEVNLSGYYEDGKNKISHYSVEYYTGAWDNSIDHREFRNVIYQKYPKMHIIGYAIRETAPSK